MYWCALAYLAILPISSTTALRNLLLLILVCLGLYSIVIRRDRLAVDLSLGINKIPLVIVLWIIFICLFPFWAKQPDVAWQNLRGQWVQSILALGVGFFVVLVLGRRGPSLWALALASAFPNFLHLLLSVAAWIGLLGRDYPGDMSILAVWSAVTHVVGSSSITTWSFQHFPWGFRGLDPMHGNLGYAACQAIALLSVCFYSAWRTQIQTRMWGAALGITFCVLSILIANSRGAVIYGVFMLALAALISVFRFKNAGASMHSRYRETRRSLFSVAMLAILSLIFFATFQSVKHDARWYSMVDKIKIGVLADDPADFLCNGVSKEMAAQIRGRFTGRGPEYADTLISGLEGQDGGRILLMRAGLGLVLESPRGLDGSRHSYQKLMEEKCGHPPVLQFAHSHQGWIDMSLALGWGGVLIFASLMSYFLLAGWRNMQNEDIRPWSFALFLISAFWILRGFADSVYREHYLQMQVVLLGYLFWRIKLAPEAGKTVEQS
jgi:hydrogenase-4 membrane subunit HyfE